MRNTGRSGSASSIAARSPTSSSRDHRSSPKRPLATISPAEYDNVLADPLSMLGSKRRVAATWDWTSIEYDRAVDVTISEAKAANIVYAAHEAWNRRDLPALSDLLDEDFTYWNNVGSPQGDTLIHGKAAYVKFLAPLAQMEGLSVPHSLRFKNGVATASVEFYARDRRTGHSHSGTFRQVLHFRDDRIVRIEEYHDAPVLASYIALLSSEHSDV